MNSLNPSFAGEIWFDGGYEKDIKDNLTGLLNKLQPNATAFNGYVRKFLYWHTYPVTCDHDFLRQGISKNAIRWIGNEMGNAPDPNWSTGESGAGDPDSDLWCPAECMLNCFAVPV